MAIPPFRLLALGDSYTVGEGVAITGSFPCQVIQRLRKAGFPCNAPEIIARTGWTAGELMTAVTGLILQPPYDFTTLLAGVNNQYRGGSVDEYTNDFEPLLELALQQSGGKKERVAVLSIPDWSVTPFAEGRERQKIAAEINTFNAVNRIISDSYGVHYIDITRLSRAEGRYESFLAEDNLHPSAKAYAEWAEKIVQIIIGMKQARGGL